MSIVMTVLGVAFAALCVGLTVRIVNRREQRAKWMAVALAIMLVAYPLSFGPAVWIMVRWHGRLPAWAIKVYFDFYHPVFLIKQNSEWSGAATDFYLHDVLCIPEMTE